jgi:hypothetical protein
MIAGGVHSTPPDGAAPAAANEKWRFRQLAAPEASR